MEEEKKMMEGIPVDFDYDYDVNLQHDVERKPPSPKLSSMIRELNEIENLSLSYELIKEYDEWQKTTVAAESGMPPGNLLPYLKEVYDLYKSDHIQDLEAASNVNALMARISAGGVADSVYGVSEGEFITHQLERTRYLKYFSVVALSLIYGFRKTVSIKLDRSWSMPNQEFHVVPSPSSAAEMDIQLKDLAPTLYPIKKAKKPRYAFRIVTVKAKISDVPKMGMEFLSAKSWASKNAILKDNMIQFITEHLIEKVDQDLHEFKVDPDSDSNVVNDGKISVFVTPDSEPYIAVKRLSWVLRKGDPEGSETSQEFAKSLMDRIGGVESKIVDMYLRLEIPIWSIADHLEVEDKVRGTISHFVFIPKAKKKAKKVLKALNNPRVVRYNAIVDHSVASMRDGTIMNEGGYPRDSHRFVITDIPDGPLFRMLGRRERFQFTDTIWSNKFARFAFLRGAIQFFDMDAMSRHVDVGLFIEDRRKAKNTQVISLTAKEFIGYYIKTGPIWMNMKPSVRNSLWKKWTSNKKRFRQMIKEAKEIAIENGQDLTLDHVLGYHALIGSAKTKHTVTVQMRSTSSSSSALAGVKLTELTQFPDYLYYLQQPQGVVKYLRPKSIDKFDRIPEFIDYLERVRNAFVVRSMMTEYGIFHPLYEEDIDITLWETIFGLTNAGDRYNALAGYITKVTEGNVPAGAIPLINRLILANGFLYARAEYEEILDANDPSQSRALEALLHIDLDSDEVIKLREKLEFLPFELEVLQKPKDTDLLLALKTSALKKIEKKKKPKYEAMVFEKLYLEEWWNKATEEQSRFHGEKWALMSDSMLHTLEYFVEELGFLPKFDSMYLWAQTRVLDAENKMNTSTIGASESFRKYVNIMAKYGKTRETAAIRSVLQVIFTGEKIIGFKDNVAIVRLAKELRTTISPSRARVARKFILEFAEVLPKANIDRTLDTISKIQTRILVAMMAATMTAEHRYFVSRIWERALAMQFIMETITHNVIMFHVSAVVDSDVVIPTDLITYIAAAQHTTESEVKIRLIVSTLADAVLGDDDKTLSPGISTLINLGDIKEARPHIPRPIYGDRNPEHLYVILYRRIWWQKTKMSALRHAPLARTRVAKIMEDGEPWEDGETPTLRGYYSAIRCDFSFEGNLDNVNAEIIEGAVTAIVPNIGLPAGDDKDPTEPQKLALLRNRFRAGKTITLLEQLRPQ